MRVLFAVFTIDVIVVHLIMDGFIVSRIKMLISSFLEIDFKINISDKKSRRFDLSEVIFKCIKVL